MSGFKGTPGPWHVEHYSRGSCEVKISRPVGTKGMGPVAYALMDLAGAMTDERISEMKANARLIAAATELLEALQKVDEQLGDVECESSADALAVERCQQIIRAAIAKATGGDA